MIGDHQQQQDRPSPSQIEQARQIGSAPLIERYGVKLRREGRLLVGLCPFHKERTPSFKVFEDGGWKCFGCEVHGDAIAWVQLTERLGFFDAVFRLIGADSANPQHHHLKVVTRNEQPKDLMTSPKVRRARAIWQGSIAANDTPLRCYFESRHLPFPPPASIRFHPDFVWSRAGMMTLPAMVVAVQSPAGQVIAIEATALAPDCSRKAFANSRHKEGELATGAVRLGKSEAVMGLAEGAETGLAAMHLTGIPVWCCLGASRMSAVAIPPEVRELHIFADDDAARHAAAERVVAAHRYVRRVVRLPPLGCKDWNDVLFGRSEGELLQIPEIAA